MSSRAHDAIAAPQPGELIAEKYVVERVLGAGGMGVVVAARHRELDSRVAIKLLRTRPAPSVEEFERFQREARAAARLKSDHVARVTDVGVLADRTPFMVLEHLEGADLAQVAHAGRLAPGLVAELVAQACEAVGEAHSHDIVHRDLKPSNLFVTTTVRGRVRLKVLDFGISKLRGARADAMTETAEGTMLGTPLYMSPEQMRSSRDVDARTDVWSLGLVMFELLTGSVPWTTSSIAALALDVTTKPAPDPRTLRADVPEGLADVVLRCLEKEPGSRFANAAELGAALAPFRTEPTPAATDALLARAAGARVAIESAPTTPAELAPAPTPAHVVENAQPGEHSRPAAPTPARSHSSLAIAVGALAIVTLGVGSMFFFDSLFKNDAPARDGLVRAPPDERQHGATPAQPEQRGPERPDPARSEDIHPRPCLSPPSPPCSADSRAWCRPEGTRVACCGAGLVPTTDGLCECPPGGATEEAAIAAGCTRASQTPREISRAIAGAMHRHVDAFRVCYESDPNHGTMSGTVTLGFWASPWGEVWDPRLDRSTLPSAQAQRCMLEELGTLRVEPPLPGSEPTYVRYPIDLRPDR